MDTSAIPLCPKHHRTGNDSYHKLGPRRFAEVHRLDVAAIAARLSANPQIRIERGAFVVRVQDDEYVLGSTRDGLTIAISEDERSAAGNRAPGGMSIPQFSARCELCARSLLPDRAYDAFAPERPRTSVMISSIDSGHGIWWPLSLPRPPAFPAFRAISLCCSAPCALHVDRGAAQARVESASNIP